jgi:hypothetical protein
MRLPRRLDQVPVNPHSFPHGGTIDHLISLLARQGWSSMDRDNLADADLAPLWGADVSAYLQAREPMTASEQMFFRGSPLAHVLRYEQELQHHRAARMHHLSQARRIRS